MKENPPDIDIARELDIFTKAHFPTNDSNDHHQQHNHTIHSTLATDYSQQHYHLGPQFTFTASTNASSSSSYFHPSGATTLQPVPAQSIAASNDLISAHAPLKNPENSNVYENYSLTYQNATTTDSTHSGSPLSGYTTPTPYAATKQTASYEEQQKQKTFDQFMSMMNMVDQRLQELGDHGNNGPFFSASPSPSHTSTSSSPSTTTARPSSLSGHHLTSKPTPAISSSTPTRGGRRKKPMGDRKGKQPAIPSATSHERNSDSNSEGFSDLDDEDDDSSPSTSNHRQDEYARDKRRRNTEASARFRVKKKMREQALRRTADEMTLRAQHLQQRVQELEKEIKWLRELIVEKKQSG